MIVNRPPTVGMDNFKWVWASRTPSEGLNSPPVLLGVLRALEQFEGQTPGNADLLKELARVQHETRTSVNLVRSSERNLMRNSQQYWKALGLLRETSPVISLTDFGRKVARGVIPMDQFATSIVATLSLPNPVVQTASEVTQWRIKGLKLFPLQLILEVMSLLYTAEASFGYISIKELVGIIIPLSGGGYQSRDIADTIKAFRAGAISLKDWPNCVPDKNDSRMAAEFLLFLNHYGFCRRVKWHEDRSERFYLGNISMNEVKQLRALSGSASPPETISVSSEIAGIASSIQRRRVLREITERPQQARFRRQLFDLAGYTCLLTGTKAVDVLEAAHIKPVEYGGADVESNGLCLRADIHTLFDRGKIRIALDGHVAIDADVGRDISYQAIPRVVAIPPFVDTCMLKWRTDYL